MSSNLQRVLAHLEALVGYDTQNPPRSLHGGAPLFDYLRTAVGDGFEVEIIDHGKGSVTFHARRGAAKVLFNVHIDTVPALGGERFPPLQLSLDDGKAYGRGACDIKGAAACLLALAEQRELPLALAFTTDEEGGEGCCVAELIASGQASAYEQVVVAEPTACLAEFQHRGFLSARGHFAGVGGHSSEARALDDNAIHRLTSWCVDALQLARDEAAAGRRSCFNIGTVSGGVKSNIIADRAEVFWSARLPPGESNEAMLARLQALPAGEHAEWRLSFSGPPLPTAGGETAAVRAQAFAARHELETGDGLDFWTEASLFGAAGIPALVLGPGHIAQAHARDEWVALEQLQWAYDIYRKLAAADV